MIDLSGLSRRIRGEGNALIDNGHAGDADTDWDIEFLRALADHIVIASSVIYHKMWIL